MTSAKITRWLGVTAVVLGLSVSIAGCASRATPAVTPSSSSAILTMTLPTDVSAKGVVLAVVLLSTADIQASIELGLVTPAEVATARQAITDKTVDLWRQRAEADLKKK